MTEENAASAATAKPCPDAETITIPVDVADSIVSIADNARSVISNYRDNIVDGSVRDGLWISNETAAFDLATAIAAINGLGTIIREFSEPDEDEVDACCEPEPVIPEGAVEESTISHVEYLRRFQAERMRLEADTIEEQVIFGFKGTSALVEARLLRMRASILIGNAR